MARKKTTETKKPIVSYEHKGKERANNPPVGLVTPETDPDAGAKKSYAFDPHLDPQLKWAGKAEHTSFEVSTVSLHVHERIDPRTIIEAVRKRSGSGEMVQPMLFGLPVENPPLREAVEFYKHAHGWSNRLVAGDSLLVMNSLLEKEGIAGKVQMVYLDPPYGIKYGSNFQPFVNKREVKDGKDEDLTAEPEQIRAFRDTWELGIHSYLTYLRDRLLLARELLTESGSIFVQISDENVHHVRELMDEVFGVGNFVNQIGFRTAMTKPTGRLNNVFDYVLWYAKDKSALMFRPLFTPREYSDENEIIGTQQIEASGLQTRYIFKYKGKTYNPVNGWRVSQKGLERLAELGRLHASGSLRFIRYAKDFLYMQYDNIWTKQLSEQNKKYVVQTGVEVIQRCMLMTTEPGDLVFDPTCGSGTTAYVAEQWGRRWITCDTSRVAITLAKQRLMTAVFDYYELAHPKEGVGSGFNYKTVPHVKLKSLANNEPPATETLYDQPLTDREKHRVSGPFTVEAVPAPSVKSVEEILEGQPQPADFSIARSGETLRQSEWRDELLRSGIRGKLGQHIRLTRLEPLPGCRYLHADGETRPSDGGKNSAREKGTANAPQRIVISFGPEHAPLEQRQVAHAIEDAQSLVPKPKLIVFAAFQFDPEAAKDIDETKWPGVTLLKAQMNADLLTDDLKKKRASNESFWLIGQPDVRLERISKSEDKGKWRVSVEGFDYYNTQTGGVESGGAGQIAVWLLDTDYDGRSLYPHQVFFPLAGENEGWAYLAKNLKAEINEDLIDAYRGAKSLPFAAGQHKRIAVKIVDVRGIESLKVLGLD